MPVEPPSEPLPEEVPPALEDDPGGQPSELVVEGDVELATEGELEDVLPAGELALLVADGEVVVLLEDALLGGQFTDDEVLPAPPMLLPVPLEVVPDPMLPDPVVLLGELIEPEVLPLMPLEPVEEPLDCAIAPYDSANSAPAVATVISLSFIGV